MKPVVLLTFSGAERAADERFRSVTDGRDDRHIQPPAPPEKNAIRCAANGTLASAFLKCRPQQKQAENNTRNGHADSKSHGNSPLTGLRGFCAAPDFGFL